MSGGGVVYRTVAVLLGLQFGSLMAWFAVEWPEPPTLVPRILGWAFFVTWGAVLGYAVREAFR